MAIRPSTNRIRQNHGWPFGVGIIESTELTKGIYALSKLKTRRQCAADLGFVEVRQKNAASVGLLHLGDAFFKVR